MAKTTIFSSIIFIFSFLLLEVARGGVNLYSWFYLVLSAIVHVAVSCISKNFRNSTTRYLSHLTIYILLSAVIMYILADDGTETLKIEGNYVIKDNQITSWGVYHFLREIALVAAISTGAKMISNFVFNQKNEVKNG
ncbi:MAG: hypothetical protein AAGJ34_00565 [Pseudomonadota bacterium]